MHLSGFFEGGPIDTRQLTFFQFPFFFLFFFIFIDFWPFFDVFWSFFDHFFNQNSSTSIRWMQHTARKFTGAYTPFRLIRPAFLKFFFFIRKKVGFDREKSLFCKKYRFLTIFFHFFKKTQKNSKKTCFFDFLKPLHEPGFRENPPYAHWGISLFFCKNARIVLKKVIFFSF